MDRALREALLACARPHHEAQTLPAVSDWPALLAAAQLHRLVPLAHQRLKESDCPELVRAAFRASALALALRTKQLQAALTGVMDALRVAGVASIVLKGPALAATVYPHPSLRPYRDLDLLCREEDWSTVYHVLVDLGFQPVQPLPAPPPKVWERKAYYHSQYYRRHDRVLVEIHYDLWQIGLRPRLGDAYWRRAVEVDGDGCPIRVLAPEDQVLHACVHLNHHGYSRLIWFSDLLHLLARHRQLDWAYLIEAARREGVALSLYFSLVYLERLFAVKTPAGVLAALRPAFPQAWLHDRLWPPAAVCGLAMDETAVPCDFHEVPGLQELANNFVLTGRRLEKLVYLGRLLAPSADWLAYYYGTSDPARLRRFRLIHAPKLIMTALAQRAPRPNPAARVVADRT